MSFSTEKATQKFQQLNETQQSIQSTSQWCLFHYRHCKELVSIWQQFFIKTLDPQKRLVLFYLCNDLVQFSKKKESKYSGFLTEFKIVLPNILKIISSDNKYPKILVSKYLRVLSVWKERIIFPPSFIDNLKLSLENSPVKPIPTKNASNSTNNTNNGNNSNNTNIKIPTEISTLVNTYIKLNSLNSLYRSQYEIFQKRNELSKKNMKNVNRDELTKLEKLCNLLILQSNEISKLRNESLVELKKLIGVVEDWIQLDSGKAENLKSSLSGITSRKVELEKNVLKEVVAQAQVQAQAQAEAEIHSGVQSVLLEQEQDAPAYEVGESDEENEEDNGMLQYINSDDDEDEDIPKYDEDEDEDEQVEEDEDKTSTTDKVEISQDLTTETTANSSNLKKRLLGETNDDKVIKKGKSVKFSEENNKTVIFDRRHSPETVGKEPEAQEEVKEVEEEVEEEIEEDIERALDDAFEIAETVQDNDALSSLLSRLS